MIPRVPLETSFFDSIAGLPVHPLAVHAAVVLLPLAALGLLVLLIVRRWRRPFGPLTVAGLAAGALAAFVAKESGEALADHVGRPEAHAALGILLPPLALALFVVATLWFWLDRRAAQAGPRSRSAASTVSGALAAVLAAATVAATVLVGHSGATAVWAGTVDAPDTVSASASSPAPSISPTTPSAPASGTASGGAAVVYTMDQVTQHADESSCWSVVDGGVYDLTNWIGQHPGGSDRILEICGTDASSAFDAEHSADSRPKDVLASYRIGTLG